MNVPADVAGMTEAAIRLELQRQKEKAEAERENSLQEEVKLLVVSVIDLHQSYCFGR